MITQLGHKLAALGILSALACPAAFAADKGATVPAKKPAPNPAMQPVQDVAGLPRVLLIGDSISMAGSSNDARVRDG